MFNINLGKFLANLRQKSGLTQEQLANKLNIDKRKISRWECGNSPPEFEILVQLQDIFHVSLFEMSIFEEIGNKSIVEKGKLKFKKLKDYKRYLFKQKFLSIMTIVIGIFLGLCAIFTIDNYGTVEVYTFKSLDSNFRIKGNYIQARNHQVFNVTDLGLLNKDGNTTLKDSLNIDVYNIEIEITDSINRFFKTNINLQEELTPQKVNLLDTINSLTFTKEKLLNKINSHSNLTFIIKYFDENYNKQSISFDFQLRKIFQNTL